MVQWFFNVSLLYTCGDSILIINYSKFKLNFVAQPAKNNNNSPTNKQQQVVNFIMCDNNNRKQLRVATTTTNDQWSMINGDNNRRTPTTLPGAHQYEGTRDGWNTYWQQRGLNKQGKEEEIYLAKETNGDSLINTW